MKKSHESVAEATDGFAAILHLKKTRYLEVSSCTGTTCLTRHWTRLKLISKMREVKLTFVETRRIEEASGKTRSKNLILQTLGRGFRI